MFKIPHYAVFCQAFAAAMWTDLSYGVAFWTCSHLSLFYTDVRFIIWIVDTVCNLVFRWFIPVLVI